MTKTVAAIGLCLFDQNLMFRSTLYKSYHDEELRGWCTVLHKDGLDSALKTMRHH